MNAYDKHMTLFELNNIVSRVLSLSMPDQYWVEAELSELREVRGHCYMDLVQKDALTNTPVARAQARCWANVWAGIRPRFERVTGQRLGPGMKVLLRVRPNFHEAYGFAWIVTDINPEFTIGDIARRRMEIIETLRQEGVMDLQKDLPLSMFTQDIAVISSRGAAGYDDFCNQLAENSLGLRFNVTLYPAVMQGESVEDSVVAALDNIMDCCERYDAVVIIRGGGATSDLSGFDTLRLAENVANFPLPVITGIGHNRDESVLDIIAHTSVKTPTAAAAFLIENLARTMGIIDTAADKIGRCVKQRLAYEQLRLQRDTAAFLSSAARVTTNHSANIKRLAERLTFATRQRLTMLKHDIAQHETRLAMQVPAAIQAQKHHLALLQSRMSALDPTLLLRRGYSITTSKGKIVKDAASLSAGDTIVTIVEKGRIESVVKGNNQG